MGQHEHTAHQVKLGLWDMASLMVGIIVGVGIYIFPALVFSAADSGAQALLIWGLGGGLSLLGALCFAELASTYPRSGGEYVYLSRAYGGWLGFLFGWAQLLINRPAATIGILAYALADYAGKLFWGSGAGAAGGATSAVLAAAVVVVLTGINILGVRLGKLTQNTLTALKVLAISAVLLAGFAGRAPGDRVVLAGAATSAEAGQLTVRAGDGTVHTFRVGPATAITVDGEAKRRATGRPWQPGELVASEVRSVKVVLDAPGADVPVSVEGSTKTLLSRLTLALILVLWTYAGWHEAAYVVAEVKDERRTIPLALMLGTGIIVVLYLLINLAYLRGLGLYAAGRSEAIAADVLGLVFGTWAGKAMALVVILSCLGATHGAIFTSSRIYSEIGADHPLFAPLGRWHPTLGTPVIALVAQGAVTLAFILGVGLLLGGKGALDTLVECTATVFWLFFFLTAVALFVLRWKDPDLPRPFRVPLYPIAPLVFAGFSLFMAYQSYIYKPDRALIGVALLATGIPVYLGSLLLRRPAQGAGSGLARGADVPRPEGDGGH